MLAAVFAVPQGQAARRAPLQRPSPALRVCLQGGCCRRLHDGICFRIEHCAENELILPLKVLWLYKLNVVDTYKPISCNSYFLLQFKWPHICCFWRRVLHTVFTGLELYEFLLWCQNFVDVMRQKCLVCLENANIVQNKQESNNVHLFALEHLHDCFVQQHSRKILARTWKRTRVRAKMSRR